MARNSEKGTVNSKAVINRIKIDGQPSFVYGGSIHDIIPWGIDNLYPTRVINTIKKSPTASGCARAASKFILGHGFNGGGEIVVNRYGETLNDILSYVIKKSYVPLNGYALHFNMNVLGQITEVFFVDSEYVRKNDVLNKAVFGRWHDGGQGILTEEPISIDLYDVVDPVEAIAKEKDEYKGQVLFFSRDADIYPESQMSGSLISASYENSVQTYSYANIENGFSVNTIVKFPTVKQGDAGKDEVKGIQNSVEDLTGAENAGGTLVVGVPTNASGEPKEFKMVEHLSPTSVDSLFEKQNKRAENDILKSNNMPRLLLGTDAEGALFNTDSYIDAFNYKNADTEGDREVLARSFNSWFKNSIFSTGAPLEITPLEMKEKEGGNSFER